MTRRSLTGAARGSATDGATGWRATATYVTYRGLGCAMGHMPEPLAQGVADGVARVMACGAARALAMNERHMRRVLASECVEGVEPDPALVRRWSRRTFDSYARYWADGARLPYEREAGVRAAGACKRARSICAPPWRSAAASSWRCRTWAAGSGAAAGSRSRACR